MRFSLRLIPILLFFVFYGLLQFAFTSLRRSQAMEYEKQSKAIQEIVVDRFQRYLELPYTIGALGKEFLADGRIMTADYEKYVRIIEKSNPEFLGFNVMDARGTIVRVFPYKNNSKAIGRISQNLGPVFESYKRKEPFFLSAPFRLFQGQQGFIFYFPVMNNTELSGWYCIVISSQDFLKKFSLDDFLKLFDVVIVDEESGRDFFATSIAPPEGTKVSATSTILFGRKMVIRTWRKGEDFIYTFPWYFSVILSLILAGASAFMLKLYEQRKKAASQLENISVLLRVTSKEAVNNLIDIHSEFNQLNLPGDEKTERLSRDINYLTNLVEQIDLLQTMAHNKEGLTDNEQNFIQLIRNQLDQFSDVIRRKNIKVEYNERDFASIVITANIWLLEKSVLSNIFSHLLINAEAGTTLRIENHTKDAYQMVKFKIRRQISGEQAKIESRRMEVARKVLQLHQGDLREDVGVDNELVISLICNA